MKVEDHIAALHALMRAEHEDTIAETRSMAEQAEAEGRTGTAQIFWDSVARLEAREKPWEKRAAS